MLTDRSQQSKGSCSFARMSSGVDSACHRLGAGAYLHARGLLYWDLIVCGGQGKYSADAASPVQRQSGRQSK